MKPSLGSSRLLLYQGAQLVHLSQYLLRVVSNVNEPCKRYAYARQQRAIGGRTLVLFIFFLVDRMAFSATSRGRFLPASLDISATAAATLLWLR